jgi:RNA polymerase sigma-70 factor (ECF subfamily)
MLSSGEFDLHIKGCAQNLRTSQKKIYTSFYSHALEVCERYAATHDEAVEILNKGFLKIFKEITKHSPADTNEISFFVDWLRKMMADEANVHYRRMNKHRILSGLGKKIYHFPDLILKGKLLQGTNQ